MEDKSFKIEAEISFEEYHKINKYGSQSPKFYYITYAITIIFLLCGIIILELLHKETSSPGVLLIVLTIPLLSKIDSKRKFKKLKDKKIVYTISDNGIRSETGDILPAKIYKWGEFRKVCENEEVFIFYCKLMDSSDFLIIPKRCLTSEGEIQSLRGFLERNVKRSRLKIKVTA